MQRTQLDPKHIVLFGLSLLIFQTSCGMADAPGPDRTSNDEPASEAVSSSDDTETRKTGLHWWKRDIDRQIRTRMKVHGVEKPEIDGPFDPDKVELGRKLFFDKILSGRKDVACATCHHTKPGAATGDGLSLGVGVGGTGKIPNRRTGHGLETEPRHSIEIFNRGLKGWKTQFWDARVQLGPNGELITPPGDKMQSGLDGVLGAQAMLPVTSRVEMRGFPGDSNPISQIPDDQVNKIWSKLMDRLLALEGYRKLFKKAYPNKKLSELKFRDAANAIAEWEKDVYTLLDAPFDKYLKGDDSALTRKQKEGAKLFYGKAGCAGCHSGTLTTDQEFHNIAVPQIGPGKGSTQPLDPGRFIVTGRTDQLFEFRTPPLRNVELTPPYMHDGAYKTLEGAIEHHLNAPKALRSYDGSQLRPELRKELHNSKSVQRRLLKHLDWRMRVRARIQQRRWHPLKITDRDVDRLVAFLKSMTSPSALTVLKNDLPKSVPSGLLEDGN